ncbi:hypothetical protein LIA77_09147 [Sarocladium implicatum]|nr:hypothetical protein LIA77_09147 [Sarocladium implicatum]
MLGRQAGGSATTSACSGDIETPPPGLSKVGGLRSCLYETRQRYLRMTMWLDFGLVHFPDSCWTCRPTRLLTGRLAVGGFGIVLQQIDTRLRWELW